MQQPSPSSDSSMSEPPVPSPAEGGEGSAVVLPTEPDDGELGARDHPRRSLKILSGGVLAAAGVGATVWAASFGFGAIDQPGPGFWPVVLGVALCASALLFLLANRDLKELFFDSDLGVAAIMLTAVFIYILLFEHVHFVVAAPLLVAGTMYLAGARKLVAIVLTSVLSTVGAWLLFFEILNVSLPL